LLAEQVGKFTLEQIEEGGKISFKASGQIDFFAEEALTCVGGAGGAVRTMQPRLNHSPNHVPHRGGGVEIGSQDSGSVS